MWPIMWLVIGMSPFSIKTYLKEYNQSGIFSRKESSLGMAATPPVISGVMAVLVQPKANNG